MAVMGVLSPKKRELPARWAAGGVLVAWDAGGYQIARRSNREALGKQLGSNQSNEGGEALFYWMVDACRPLI